MLQKAVDCRRDCFNRIRARADLKECFLRGEADNLCHSPKHCGKILIEGQNSVRGFKDLVCRKAAIGRFNEAGYQASDCHRCRPRAGLRVGNETVVRCRAHNGLRVVPKEDPNGGHSHGSASSAAEYAVLDPGASHAEMLAGARVGIHWSPVGRGVQIPIKQLFGLPRRIHFPAFNKAFQSGSIIWVSSV